MPLTGGTFTGPELNGKLLPGSIADWRIVLPDGSALGDIRLGFAFCSGVGGYAGAR